MYIVNFLRLFFLLLFFNSCAKTATAGQGSVTLVDLEMGFRGNVNPYSYFYYFAFMLEENVEAELRGGVLKLSWAGEGKPIFMNGPVSTVYDGEIEL